MNKLALGLVLFASIASVAPAQEAQEVHFANVFNDRAVLQRDQATRIWGAATPGQRVTVTITEDAKVARRLAPAAFAEANAKRRDGRRDSKAPPIPTVRARFVDTEAQPFAAQTKHAQSGNSGAWEVRFDPMPASFAPKFVIASIDGAATALKDLLIGDVWLTSGQSNMVWGAGSDREWDLERLSVDYPAVRLCRILKFTSKKLTDLERRIQWAAATPENAELGRFSGVSFFFAIRMHRALKVPIGIVHNAVGGSMAETWISPESLAKLPACQGYLEDYAARLQDWPNEEKRRVANYRRRVRQAKEKGMKPPRRPRLTPPDADRNQPSGCYNGSIWPIRKLTLRGALFLQGENNAMGKWNMYAESFPQMIRDWRRDFATPELPFGIISLQGFGPYGRDTTPEQIDLPPGAFWYAAIREVHRKTHLMLPHTGLIAAHDVGDTANIHPGVKREVGQRAARWALATIHGKPVLHTGPVYESMRIDGNKIVLSFAMDPNLGKVLKIKAGEVVWWRDYPISRVGKEYRGFTIAGADRRFWPADIRRGERPGTLEATSPHVPAPKAVRYAWAGYPDANAIGHEFLPVFPFRTDDWPLYPDTPYGQQPKKQWKDKLRADRQRAERLALERRVAEMQRTLDAVQRELAKGQDKAARESLQGSIEALKTVLAKVRQKLKE